MLVLFWDDEVVLKDVFGALCGRELLGGVSGGVRGCIGSIVGILEVLGRFEV